MSARTRAKSGRTNGSCRSIQAKTRSEFIHTRAVAGTFAWNQRCAFSAVYQWRPDSFPNTGCTSIPASRSSPYESRLSFPPELSTA